MDGRGNRESTQARSPMSADRLTQRIQGEEGVLDTIEHLIHELRQELTLALGPTERARLERDLQRQEGYRKESQARLDELKLQSLVAPVGSSAGPPPTIRSDAVESPLRVFVSYSHEESPAKHALFERLLRHLKPAQEEGLVDVFSDRNIGVGQRWHDSLTEQVAQADVAILLIGERFLASDYIRHEEMPAILARYDAGSLVLVPVLLDTCDFKNASYGFQAASGRKSLVLGAIQAVASMDQALSNVGEADVGRVLLKVATTIRQLATQRRSNVSAAMR